MTVVFPTGKWWRFSDYVIVDGSIQPAPGAELQEYNPWLELTASKERGSKAARPYQELLSVLQGLDFRPSAAARPTAIDQLFDYSITEAGGNQIISWCRRYGLLGLLTQECPEIVLPIRLRGRSGQTPYLDSEHRRYTRTAYRWIEQLATVREAEGQEAAQLIDKLVNLALITPDPTEPEALAGSVDDWDAVHYSINLNVVRQYGPSGFREASFQSEGPGDWIGYGELYWSFKSMSFKQFKSFPLPLPLTPDFWRVYTEPVIGFVHAAAWLRQSLLKIKTMEEEQLGSEETAWEGAGMLANLTNNVSPALAFDDMARQFRLGWIFPSLLSSLAMMITEDLTEDHRLHICETCGAPFMSSAYQATYCSPRCRFRMQKRRQRKGCSQ